MGNRYLWLGSAGLLNDPNHWADQFNNTPAGPPTSADEADFFLSGSLSGNGVAQIATFGTGPFTLTGTLTLAGRPIPPFLPFALTVKGALTVDAGTLDASGGTTVIDGSPAASMTVQNGGTVKSLGTSLGNASGQTGSLLLTGARTTWTDLVDTNLDTSTNFSGYTTIGANGTGNLTVTAGAALTTGRSAFLGLNAGSSGTGTISNGGSWTAEALNVGLRGTGDLAVHGGSITVNGGDATSTGFLNVGHRAGSQGSLMIDAGGTVRNAQSAQAGPTPNFLTNIGYEGTGTVTVSGIGSLLDAGVNGLSLGLGATAGSGTLLVEKGGTVRTATFDSTLLRALSLGKVGTGALTVTDAGSSIISNGSTGFGRGGTGHLAVENHASFTGGSANPNSSLLIGSGGVAVGGHGSSGAAWLYGGTADALVTTGGLLTSLYNLTVGSGGSTGTLTVQNQGIATAAHQVVIGAAEIFAGTEAYNGGAAFVNGPITTVAAGTSFAGTGTVNVNAGGTLRSTNSAASGIGNIVLGAQVGSTGTLNASGSGALVDSGVNHFTAGSSGMGSAAFAQGASLLATTSDDADPALILGSFAGAVGVLDIASGATATATGDVIVGRMGAGHLLVESGGTLASGNNASFTEQGFRIALLSGGRGDATVTGTGSWIHNVGRFEVGVAGRGSLAITGGGSVVTSFAADPTQPGADIAVGAGADNSEVTVSDAGSDWNIAGRLLLGDAAAGRLSLLAGATVEAGDVDLGVQAAGSGTLTLQGAGSHLTASGTLTVGDAGSGQVDLSAGTEITASNVVIGSLGVVNSSGGILDPLTIHNHGTLGGSGSAVGAIDNGGKVYAVSGTYEVTGDVTGSGGTLELDNGGTLRLDAGVSAGQTVVFTDPSGKALIEQPGGFDGTIQGFQNGNLIFAAGADHGSYAAGLLTLFDAGNARIGALNFIGNYTTSSFAFDGSGDIQLCFLAGSRIRTPVGDRAVEMLRAGDLVVTASGEHCPIVWIGRRETDTTRHPRPERVRPVRVRRGAFGEGLPERDLLLSPDHALFIDGVLIPVKYLVDGRTVLHELAIARPTYFHVELDRHEILLAEGLPAESLVPGADRSAFANGGGPVQLHPDFHALAWEAEGCAPLVVTGPVLEAARARLTRLAA